MSKKRAEFMIPDRQRAFTLQLLEGIKFLHSQQIVHGDLRPKNVLFDFTGQLKITDFGLAQKVSYADDSFTWQHGGPDGLGGWFAPEVYLRERKTIAVDMFSAGCMIYWVLANGKHPFNNNPFNVVRGHYDGRVLSSSPEAYDLVGWMMAQSSIDRPNIDEVLEHPYLWSYQKRMLYLSDVGNKIDQFKDNLESVCWSCDRGTSSEGERRWICSCEGGNARLPWRTAIDAPLMNSLLRRRKYPDDSALWLVRFFRNLDQHFHDQLDDGLLCLRLRESTAIDSTLTQQSDMEWLQSLKASSSKQRDVISQYIKSTFPTLILSLWRIFGDIS